MTQSSPKEAEATSCQPRDETCHAIGVCDDLLVAKLTRCSHGTLAIGDWSCHDIGASDYRHVWRLSRGRGAWRRRRHEDVVTWNRVSHYRPFVWGSITFGHLSHKGLVMLSFDDCHVVSLNNLLNKQSICLWFKTLSPPYDIPIIYL